MPGLWTLCVTEAPVAKLELRLRCVSQQKPTEQVPEANA